jgi:hypothetical protein
MSGWLGESRDTRDGVTIPTIWVALALSLLIHVAVMWQWLPRIRLPSLDEPEHTEARGQLRVRLAPPPGPPPALPPAMALRTPPSPALQARPPIAVRPPPAPPVIALNPPAPSTLSPPAVPSVTAPNPARPPADGDLASYIEARRRARADPAPAAPSAMFPESVATAPPVDDDKARANRLAAANLASQRKLTFGYDPTKSGGVFQIMRMGYEDAEFIFFGWNKEIRRNTAQQIEVRKGSNSDIRIAVVRRMIAIIREYENEDFLWESHRLGRNVTLSARLRDNAGLVEFMRHEFFDDPRLPR